MKCNIKLNGELSRDILQDFAKYIIPCIRDFTYSDEGKRYISIWMRNHPEYEDNYVWDYVEDEDDEY